MICERQAAAEKIERHDLFSQLLEANDNNLDATTLTESELIGDYFSSEMTYIDWLLKPIPRETFISSLSPGMRYVICSWGQMAEISFCA
jgi:hypothetical protein